MIWRAFLGSMAAGPGREAVVFGDARHTYEAFASSVVEMGGKMAGGRAIRRRALVRHQNPAELLQRVFACWSRGVVPVVLRDSTTVPQILECRERLNPEFILIDDVVPCAPARAPTQRAPTLHEAADFHPRDEALILCTSASTGAPKFVALPAESVLLNATTIADRKSTRLNSSH